MRATVTREFAWRPVWTWDADWVWLRHVWRRGFGPYDFGVWLRRDGADS
jgi:hypothetical protein